MKKLQKLTYIISSAYILLFFSEYFFLNEEPTFSLIEILTSNPIELFFLIEYVGFYAFFAYSMFIAMDRYKVKSIWQLILAASLFGWWTEGVVIPLMYEALPFSIIWPSIGWHVLIDVLLGWYLVRKILQKNKPVYTLLTASGLGLYWGVWATWYWADDVRRIMPSDFMIFTFFTSTLLIIAYWGVTRYPWTIIKISSWETIIFIVFSFASLAFLISFIGVLPIIVFLLISLTVLGILKASMNKEHPDELKNGFDNKAKYWQFPILYIMPIVASLVYKYLYSRGLSLEITLWIPPFLMLSGAIVLALALYKVVFSRSRFIKSNRKM